MIKFISNYLYNKYKDRLYIEHKDDLVDYYIEQELPLSVTDIKDKKILKYLSDMYESEGYKIFSKLLGNYKNRLGYKLMKVDSNEERKTVNSNTVMINKYSESYLRGFFRGQAYVISYILSLVRKSYRKMKKEEYNK